MMTIVELREAVAYGPISAARPAAYRGCITRGGHRLCASCASRLIGRGVTGELREVVWDDTDDGSPCVVCS